MVPKSSFLLLVLAVSQAFAMSVNPLQIRGLEILESRQAGCPVCTAFTDSLTSCSKSYTPGTSSYSQCACSSNVSSQVQSCVNCGIGAGVSPTTIDKLIESYSQLCPGTTITKTSTSGGSGISGGSGTSGATSDKRKRAGVAAIGAMVGAALVL